MAGVEKLKDPGAERAIIGAIFKHGNNAFIEADDFVDSKDFGVDLNRILYTCFSKMHEDGVEVFDPESVKIRATSLGFGQEVSQKKAIEYIELVSTGNVSINSIRSHASQIKKLSVVRELHARYTDCQNYLSNIDGTEKMSEILTRCESETNDYINGLDSGHRLERLGDGISEFIEELISRPPVAQMGIPTGFPLWDEYTGGGPRRGTISFIVARSKSGKSFHASNIARNVCMYAARDKRKAPTLILDTELTKIYQQSRMIGIHSGVPIKAFETGQFQGNKLYLDNVRRAGKEIQQLPITYESIAGMHIPDILRLIKRWIIKEVGFNESGKANDCVIVYDYLKLMSGDGLSKSSPEYILLGLMMTELHNFAVKYDVPIVVYGQSNRDGIDTEDTSIAAGSDRILWLCSNMTILKNKDETDISLGCDFTYGNKKLIVLETRHGSGMPELFDYINIKASLKPGVGPEAATGLMTEGFTYSELVRTGVINNAKPNDSKADNRDGTRPS